MNKNYYLFIFAVFFNHYAFGATTGEPTPLFESDGCCMELFGFGSQEDYADATKTVLEITESCSLGNDFHRARRTKYQMVLLSPSGWKLVGEDSAKPSEFKRFFETNFAKKVAEKLLDKGHENRHIRIRLCELSSASIDLAGEAHFRRNTTIHQDSWREVKVGALLFVVLSQQNVSSLSHLFSLKGFDFEQRINVDTFPGSDLENLCKVDSQTGLSYLVDQNKPLFHQVSEVTYSGPDFHRVTVTFQVIQDEELAWIREGNARKQEETTAWRQKKYDELYSDGSSYDSHRLVKALASKDSSEGTFAIYQEALLAKVRERWVCDKATEWINAAFLVLMLEDKLELFLYAWQWVETISGEKSLDLFSSRVKHWSLEARMAESDSSDDVPPVPCVPITVSESDSESDEGS